MPLGTEVWLVPGDIVLDGDPAPPNAKVHNFFGPLLWPASSQARILPITRIVDEAVRGGRLSWQFYRSIATRLVKIRFKNRWLF